MVGAVSATVTNKLQKGYTMEKMKMIALSMITATGLAMAGGDISPVASVVTQTTDDSGFYVTGKIGAGQTFETSDWNYFDDGDGNNVYNMVGLGAGYRYRLTQEWFVDGELGLYTSFYGADGMNRTDYDVSIRPGYTFGGYGVDLYGIIAETYTKIEGHGHDWTTGIGAGIGYNVTDNLKITAEYQYQIQDFNGYDDVKNDKIMAGLRYTF
jgi:opacity protein-like surface antigen